MLLGSASCASARVVLERSQYEAAWQLFTRVGVRGARAEARDGGALIAISEGGVTPPLTVLLVSLSRVWSCVVLEP
jgi:hypothetical protein